MIKYFIYIFLSLSFFNLSIANDIDIQENINLSFVCELNKKIIKNSEYNYQTFLAKDLNEKGLDQFKIEAIKPETLFIDGLSLFLSKSEKLKVKVVNKDVVLFKAIDLEKKYSESAIIDRKSGELIHEINRNIKSEKSEKDLDKFKIEAIRPETLFIDGLSLFLSESEKLKVKVVNKDVVLFKAIDTEKKYSESAIIDRKSGELIHEINRNIKSENSEKDISFYLCSNKEKKV